MQRIGSREIKDCVWMKVKIQRTEVGLFRKFGHLEKMAQNRLIKKVYKSGVDKLRSRGNLIKCWRWSEGGFKW